MYGTRYVKEHENYQGKKERKSGQDRVGEKLRLLLRRSLSMPQCQKRKNRVSSNSSIPSLDSRDGESSSPAEKKKRNVFSDDEDAGEALNLSVNKNVKVIPQK